MHFSHMTVSAAGRFGAKPLCEEPFEISRVSIVRITHGRIVTMPRWMFAFPVVLLLLAAVIVFAFTRTGPTDHQDTHAQEAGQTR